jgi:chromosome segregation ATPase
LLERNLDNTSLKGQSEQLLGSLTAELEQKNDQLASLTFDMGSLTAEIEQKNDQLAALSIDLEQKHLVMMKNDDQIESLLASNHEHLDRISALLTERDIVLDKMREVLKGF